MFYRTHIRKRASVLLLVGIRAPPGRIEEAEPMLKVRLKPEDADAVCRMLEIVRCEGAVPAETRSAAAAWLGTVRPTMERLDVQSVAWVLREASSSRGMPRGTRKKARHLAAYLEGRM
jgi:hypothetical protein